MSRLWAGNRYACGKHLQGLPTWPKSTSKRFSVLAATSSERSFSEKYLASAPKEWKIRTRSTDKAFRYPFRHFCRSCGTGSSMLTCKRCKGGGFVLTMPGGAGSAFKMGDALCKTCFGSGVVPCPVCGGREVILPPPDPENGPPKLAADEEQSIWQWLEGL